MTTSRSPSRPAASELDYLLQQDCRNNIIPSIGQEPWVTVYRFDSASPNDFGIQSALIPGESISKMMKDPYWDLHIGSARPHFVTNYSGADQSKNHYHRYDSGGVEPLVIHRDFHRVKNRCLEINEEFRLYHNLYHDHSKNIFVKFDETGDEIEVVRFEKDAVLIRLKELRQFLAPKNMHLLILFDSVRFSEIPISEVPEKEKEQGYRDDTVLYKLSVCENDLPLGGHKTFSRLVGKKLILPFPIEQCGLWPYKEEEDEDVPFIIGVDAGSNPVEYTSNPKHLANFFGANPSAPQYVTPVFFRQEVLTKYFSDPERFSVEDGHISCAGLWSMRVDNNHEKYIIAFLGDLGRDLPLKERLYWKPFNIPPDGTVSAVTFRRSFMGQFTDPSRPDLLFKSTFTEFQVFWSEKAGWPLFLPLDEKDAYLFRTLHIPIRDSQLEFDGQILALTKIIVDSLNEKKLIEIVGAGPPDEKGISKFERFLAAKNINGRQPHIEFMRDLQSLRSAGVGHRKGDRYEELAKKMKLSTRPLSEVFSEFLNGATALLNWLKASGAV